MQRRSHSLRDYCALHLALVVFVCVVVAFLSGNSLTRVAATDCIAQQIGDRVEQTEAPNLTTVPVVPIDIGAAEDLPQEAVELPEPTDDDESKHALLQLCIAASSSQSGLYESSADRVLTRFRLLAFSSRGSPSA